MFGLTAAQAARLDPALVADLADWTAHPDRHDPDDLLARVTEALSPNVTVLDLRRRLPDSHIRPRDLAAGMWVRPHGPWRRIEAVRERWDDTHNRIVVQLAGRPQLATVTGDTPVPFSEHPVGHGRADKVPVGATVWCDACTRWDQVAAVSDSCEGRELHTSSCVVLAWPWEPVTFQIVPPHASRA